MSTAGPYDLTEPIAVETYALLHRRAKNGDKDAKDALAELGRRRAAAAAQTQRTRTRAGLTVQAATERARKTREDNQRRQGSST